MIRSRRGISLALALAAIVLVGWCAALALEATAIRSRLAADGRWRTEGQLLVSTALAGTRVAHRADLDTLADGSSIDFGEVVRPDGWRWRVQAARTGAVIRLISLAQRRASDGSVVSARRATLLLIRDNADTVRVLTQHPRF